MACENDLAEVNELFDFQEAGLEVATDVEIYYSDSANVRVIIKGPKMVRYQVGKARDEFPEGLHVDFLETDGTISSTLDAASGERYNVEKKVIVRGDKELEQLVILKNDRGEKLETSELTWDEMKSKVYTEKFVKITNQEEIIFAYGFEANQDFSEYELKQVVGRVDIQTNDIN